MDPTPSSPSIIVSLGEQRSYPICFARIEALPGLLSEAGLSPGPVVIVTDEHVGGHYGSRIEEPLANGGWAVTRITVTPGEVSKSASTVEMIYDRVLTSGIERSTPLIALGGGVVGDLAGFAASTLLRGIPFFQVPTSLLAMVDSAIGGKTGINHSTGKNLIGTFYQPKIVCTDISVLDTLPDDEWTNGLSEVVKHALISSSPFFGWLSKHFDRVLRRDPNVTLELISQAAAIKARIVSQDEKESGLRVVLNFGHTFAHALESTLGYGAISHGQAVLVGMKAALSLSKRFNPDLDTGPAFSLLAKLPHPNFQGTVDISRLIESMKSDKKSQHNRVRFVLLKELGNPYVFSECTEDDITKAWKDGLKLT